MSEFTTLSTGAKMPTVGLGTWKAGVGEVKTAVYEAIKVGYRHIDCACDYGNEHEVGAGIKQALDEGLCKREDLWITSKLWNTYHAKEHVELACRKTLTDLGLDYVDLYLIHFPISLKFIPFETRYPPEWVVDPNVPELNKMEVTDVTIAETWGAMEELQTKGLAKNIGVSNFTCQTLMDMLKWCKIPPAVNQVEIHPYNSQVQLGIFCKWKGITITGFSPLGAKSYSWLDGNVQAALLDDPVLKGIADKHKRTPAAVAIRWQVQRGFTVVPKSCNPGRMAQNLHTFDLELCEEDMNAINALDKGRRYNDPGDFCKGMGFPETGYPIYG